MYLARFSQINFSASIFVIPYHDTLSKFGPTGEPSSYGPPLPSKTKSVEINSRFFLCFLHSSTTFFVPSTFIFQHRPFLSPLCFSAESTSVNAENKKAQSKS